MDGHLTTEMWYTGMRVFDWKEKRTMAYNISKKEVAEILACTSEKVEEKLIPGHDLIYYRNTDRGGGALIVSKDGEMLFADPFFIDYETHIQKFMSGERTSFD